MGNRRDKIHLELSQPLGPVTGDDQHRHIDHQHQQDAKADRQIAAAHPYHERPQCPSPAMSHEQAPIQTLRTFAKKRKPGNFY